MCVHVSRHYYEGSVEMISCELDGKDTLS